VNQPGVILTEGLADAVVDAARSWTAHRGSLRSGEWSGAPTVDVVYVRVTSSTVDANGNCPGVITNWDQTDGTWTDYGTVKIKPAVGGSLVSGIRYAARLGGEISGTPLCLALGGGSSVAVVKVTSVTPDAAGYPAKVQVQDSTYHIWNDSTVVRLIMSNSETPTLNKRYLAWDTGVTQTVSGTTYSIYASDYFPDPLQVWNDTVLVSSPSYLSCTTSTGLYAADAGGGRTNLAIYEADQSQAGALTDRSQRIWGTKQFVYGLVCNDTIFVDTIIAPGSGSPQPRKGGLIYYNSDSAQLYKVDSYTGSFDYASAAATGAKISIYGTGVIQFARATGTGGMASCYQEPTIKVGNGNSGVGGGFDTGTTGTIRGITFRAGFATGSSGISGYTGTVP